MTARERSAPVMAIRAARVPAGGWIVHDLRDPSTVRMPPWRRPAPRRWRRYPTHTEAMRAACRAIKGRTVLPVPTSAFTLAR
ncbi:hypothetical protein FK529_05650 [Tsukamurella asaccharolytica]|uniref:Uncharacterized protein n=1 Tax=Tsukamurella asaccharolytica TaxID=2592067 RepID=A0A5C5RCJ4_9ACTN|nr:hypothetical protein [Tsukamurella asaccharolytica]TWS20807.1 hypothetical protein FK529_05650 [Tsukamurella asaccharolytica]